MVLEPAVSQDAGKEQFYQATGARYTHKWETRNGNGFA